MVLKPEAMMLDWIWDFQKFGFSICDLGPAHGWARFPRFYICRILAFWLTDNVIEAVR